MSSQFIQTYEVNTSQFCLFPRNFASRAFTKNTMAWLTGVSIPCLEHYEFDGSYHYDHYFFARATTRPLIKSTSDCLFFRTSTHMEVLFSWRESITCSICHSLPSMINDTLTFWRMWSASFLGMLTPSASATLRPSVTRRLETWREPGVSNTSL